MKCRLYDYKGNIIYKTNTIEEMNKFIQNDGAEYNIMNIDNYENDIRIDFESGSQLFLIAEK